MEQTSSRIRELEDMLQNFNDRISALKARYFPTYIRNAMQILERWIALVAAGSWTRFRLKFYNLRKIDTNGDPAVRVGLASVLGSCGLTADHLGILEFLKEVGDLYSYTLNHPTMTADEWEQMIVGGDDANDPDEAAIRDIKLDLLLALAHFCPRPANRDDPWLIEGPEKKPRILLPLPRMQVLSR